MKLYEQLPDEPFDLYCHRISALHSEGVTWNQIRDIINSNTGACLTADTYRKRESRFIYPQYELQELKKERLKLAEERSQNTALLRRISREETLIEMAHVVAESMNTKHRLPEGTCSGSGNLEAILQISDWHYGIEISNAWNTYNPDIAKQRISQLQTTVIDKCQQHNIHTLHIVNLGDMIAGRIHLPLRINSRFDIITQIMEVSELLAQFISKLGQYFNIRYYSTLDNHSRLEPNLKESLDLESLVRITTWYLRERLPWLQIQDNTFGDDIVTFNVLDHVIAGVHGDHDKPSKVVQNLTLLTQQHYDLILSAHLHHLQVDEINETLLVQNGSLMGVDDYAKKLRCSSSPSQNLIIVSTDCVMEALYRIKLY